MINSSIFPEMPFWTKSYRLNNRKSTRGRKNQYVFLKDKKGNLTTRLIRHTL